LAGIFGSGPQSRRDCRFGDGQQLNPVGIGSSAAAAILNPYGVGLRYALREVKPRKQLRSNSFRGLKRQTVFKSVTVPLGTVTDREISVRGLRAHELTKKYIFFIYFIHLGAAWAGLARAYANY